MWDIWRNDNRDEHTYADFHTAGNSPFAKNRGSANQCQNPDQWPEKLIEPADHIDAAEGNHIYPIMLGNWLNIVRM
ncbi:hypothetical protein OS31_29590 [Dickeya oryzae]